MRGTGSLKGFVAAVIAVAFVASSLDTAWTARTPSFTTNVDPSLRAGEVALVHTIGGHAGALSLKLSELGAVDVETEYAANTVIARLSSAALAAVATDPTVTIATRDIPVVALDGSRGKSGFEKLSGTPALPMTGWRSWTQSGDGINVAVMDTGIADHPDLSGKVRARIDFVHDGNPLTDPGGHGTFIAGLIAANGGMTGVAPNANLVSLRVLDANGRGTLSGVVAAFNWVLQQGASTKVDVLNLSWGAPQATSYQKDILSALVEAAWFSGVTVVVASGNEGPTAGSITAPASDPFVVSVGSYNDLGTTSTLDDVFSSFTGRGPTLDGFMKPDILAPGEHVVSLRAPGVTYLDADGLVIGSPTDLYIHMTGTSASAAYVSGVAALVAAARWRYSPTQIKGAIVASARPILGSTAGAVDAANALVTAPASVNVGLAPSQLLLSALTTMRRLKVNGVTWEGVTWDGITWESVSWESVSWESVSWETVTWEGVTWEDMVSGE